MATKRIPSHWPEVDLPWEQDPIARAVVAAHPEGMQMRHIAVYLDAHHERVNQIQKAAIAKLKKRPGLYEAFRQLIKLHRERDAKEDADIKTAIKRSA